MSRINLFTIADEVQWNKALDNYKQSIAFVEKSKKKGNNLQQLDDWYEKMWSRAARPLFRGGLRKTRKNYKLF